ncbi:MAG: AI-2E family transporter [Blastocatellia bacterium]|nr:AI-2E family transporter [Blastocatellia bacterium]
MTPKRSSQIFLIVITAAAVLLCGYIFLPFLEPILWATMLAVVFFPVHARLQKRIKSPNLAALASIGCVLLTVIIPATVVGILITSELTDFYHWLSAQSAQDGGWGAYVLHQLEKPMQFASRFVDVSKLDVKASVLTRLQQVSGFLLGKIGGIFGNAASILITAAFTIFIMFFLFREGRHIRRRLAVVLPLQAEQTEKLFTRIGDTITATMYGGIAVALAQGTLTGISFWFLGLPSPILWGVVAAVVSLVPLVGSGLVWVPAALVLLLSGHWIKGLILLGWGIGVVSSVDNIIRPWIIQDKVQLHTLLIFFALLGGVQAFGMLGLFIGPVIVSIAQVLLGFMREESANWNQPERPAEEPPSEHANPPSFE